MNRGNNLVTPDNGPRPAGSPDQCFYCGQAVGTVHKPMCVIPERTVMVRAVIEYPITVPEAWTPADVEAHRNKSSWCAGSIINELRALSDCLCPLIEYAYVREATDEDHKVAGFEWEGEEEAEDLDPSFIDGERTALQEVISTLRVMHDHAEGGITRNVYRNLIQLFENREKAAALRLEPA